ncbi:uncharacterized protein LOC102808665, partial [Saccoglossus kowalevskii]|uniref:Uncharacterized protein LOC102808665 n=1 Tax=Saccoglossus kowalevskii TaxID=10224 RepID=A0ABM0N1E3_SACKO
MRHLKRQLLITCFFCCMSLSCYLFFVDNKHIGHRLPPDELPLRALKITENTEENTKVDNVTSSVFSSSKNISDSKKSNDTSVEVKPLPIAVYPNCTIKKSLSNMRLFTNRFKEDYPPFLSPGFMKWDVQMSQYPPPFGMKTA